MKVNLCTYFDKNYLSKFLACRDSINKHEKNAYFFCLCLDDFTFDYLTKKNFKDLKPISLKQIEQYF